MEEHFLKHQVEGSPEFRAEPWYNRHGDCVVFQMADEAVIGERIDEVLTIYLSAIDRRPIGFQVKGVSALILKFGVDGLQLDSVTSNREVQSVSVSMLLLAAYEDGPLTLARRRAYAGANATAPPSSVMPVSELVPA